MQNLRWDSCARNLLMEGLRMNLGEVRLAGWVEKARKGPVSAEA